MSERHCPGCSRPLPWRWPQGPSLEDIGRAMREGTPLPSDHVPGAIIAPTCSQVPDDYGKGWVDWAPSCAKLWDAEYEFEKRQREREREEDEAADSRRLSRRFDRD